MQLAKRAIIFGSLLLAANIGFADKVTTDFDHHANFANYKTFTWVEHPATADAFMGDRIMQAVNTQLQARDLRPVSNGADLGVSASLNTEEKHVVNTLYSGGDFWGGGWATTTVDTYIVGTLVVNVFDAKTKKLLWQGVGSDTMSRHPEKRTKTVDKMVMKMLTEFPSGIRLSH